MTEEATGTELERARQWIATLLPLVFGVAGLLLGIPANDPVSGLIVGVLFGFGGQLLEARSKINNSFDDLHTDMNGTRTHFDALLDERFHQIGQAATIYEGIKNSVIEDKKMVGLIQYAGQLDKAQFGGSLIHKLIDEEIECLHTMLRDIVTSQSATRDREEMEWLMSLTRNAGTSIDAISTSIDTSFWTDSRGARYLLAQEKRLKLNDQKAADDRFHIRRLFVFDPSTTNADASELLRKNYEVHAQSGIDVRVFERGSIPGLDLDDTVIFDGQIAYLVGSFAPNTNHVQSTRLVLNRTLVTRLAEDFQLAWDSAEAFTSVL